MSQKIFQADNKPRVLVLDDEKNILRSIEIALTQENIEVMTCSEWRTAIHYIENQLFDLLIVDIQLSDSDLDGIGFLKRVYNLGFQIPTLFISGHATLSQAAQAIKLGGIDFIEKPFNADKLIVTVQRCIELKLLQNKLLQYESEKNNSPLIGETPQIQKLKNLIAKIATSNANILILGESGTGKELVAQSIHQGSQRAAFPFITVNCSSIPESLIESELFGFEKGSFTSAITSRKGYFELAHRGTIFLDEIADLSLSAQAKILRVLQNGEIQKLGSEKFITVNVRVLSATHKNLKEMVINGSFREDLYYRLNVIPIDVPNLRERKDDIPLLAQFFIQKILKKNNLKDKLIDSEFYNDLKQYNWPGNVRELQNLMERVLILSGHKISSNDLPEEILATIDMNSDFSTLTTNITKQLSLNNLESRTLNDLPTLKSFRDKAEQIYIIKSLQKNEGNVSQTAIELGVGRTYLHKRINQLEILKKDYQI